MKIKMEKAVQMYDALVTLSQTEAPFRVNYWIMMNLNVLQPHFDMFSKERDLIYRDCLYKGQDGLYVHSTKNGGLEFNVIESKKNEWILRFDKLNNFEINFSPIYLDLDALAKENTTWNFRGNLLYQLDSLIKKHIDSKNPPGRRNHGTNHKAIKG